MDQPDLFPEPAVPRTRHRGLTEPHVNWLIESTRPEAVTARSNINAWYRKFPDANGSFGARLRSDDNENHGTALDELHVHHLLRQCHPDVAYEGGNLGPTSRVCDFHVLRNDAPSHLIEVLSLYLKDEYDRVLERHGRLADFVNARLSPTAGYFVRFDFGSPVDPRPADFLTFLRQQLAALPSLEGPARQERRDHQVTYSKDGARITVRFLAMREGAPSQTNPDARIVALGPFVGGFMNPTRRLKSRFSKKSGSRYGIEGKPFLLVTYIHDILCDLDDIVHAIYGTTHQSRDGLVAFKNDGFFGSDLQSHGKPTRTSAIAVVRNFSPCNPEASQTLLFKNPHATVPWPDDAFPITRTLTHDECLRIA